MHYTSSLMLILLTNDDGINAPGIVAMYRELIKLGEVTMPEILAVTGACGAGKSTICQLWAAARQGACVQGDEIRNWICADQLRKAHDYQEALVVNTVTAAAKDLLAQGVDVALDSVWFPPSLERLRNALSGSGKMRFVWLQCRTEENHRRDQLRSTQSRMGHRVDELQRELEAVSWPAYIHALDTSFQTASETIQTIEMLPATG